MPDAQDEAVAEGRRAAHPLPRFAAYDREPSADVRGEPAAVQRILRHSDPRITTEVYGHLLPGYLRSEIDRLSVSGDFAVSTQSEFAEDARA
jgi:integrase